MVAGEQVLGSPWSNLLLASGVPLMGLLRVIPFVNGLLKGRGIHSQHVQVGTMLSAVTKTSVGTHRREDVLRHLQENVPMTSWEKQQVDEVKGTKTKLCTTVNSGFRFSPWYSLACGVGGLKGESTPVLLSSAPIKWRQILEL